LVGGNVIEASLIRGISKNSDVFRLLMEHVPAAVAIFDREMRYLACSPRWLTDHGLINRSVVGLSHYEVFPDVDERWRAVHARAMAGETLSSERDRFQRSDGKVDWVRWTMAPWHEAGGAVGGTILTAQVLSDNTDENAHLQAVAAREAMLRSILATVPEGLVVIDENGNILTFNASAERIFGYAADEVLGRNVSTLMAEPDRSLHDVYIAQHLATMESRIIGLPRRVLGRRKDGTVFPHMLCMEKVVAGEQHLFTGFIQDLTEREEAEAQLRELQAELMRVSRIGAAGTLASALAHELNQPLTAVANYMQSATILLDDRDDETDDLLREALGEAGKEALRAGAVVRRLREFIGRGELQRTNERPDDLAHQAVSLSLVGTRNRGIACITSVPASLPSVLVDRVQVQQVLFNLVRNALEALGDNGHIEVRATRQDDMVCFTVTDDGPGIPTDSKPDLFEPFISSKASGMGIGLSICQRIVEAHGGKLWHDAPAAGGAVFHFTVPITDGDSDDV
jgi:two-component system sensor kinase FixL